MADVVPISGGPEEAKIRSVFAPALLPIITLFIYYFVWWYKINRELADLGRKHGREDLGTKPGLSLIAVLLGWILILPPLFSAFGTWKRLKAAQELVGISETERGNGVIAALLYVFVGIVFPGYVQNELNKVWRAQAGVGAPSAAAAAAVAPATPAASADSTSIPGIPGN